MSLIAIVGRPNVGKSTLFNRLVGRRLAIVEGIPGVTRDRHYADAVIDGRRVTLVDTGGLNPDARDELLASMAGQAELAVREADLILFVTDVHQGLLPADQEIAAFLRRRAKDVVVVANKADAPRRENAAVEFHSLGFDAVFPVSAEHDRGVGDLTDEIVRRLGPAPEEAPAAAPERAARVAVLGRPNVGKSSFINRVLGAERLVVSSVAGTTRDAIDARVTIDGRSYVLIDTAGIRKKSRVERGVELWSVLKAIRTIDRAEVCVVMADAAEGVTDQDLRILDLVFRGGRGAVLCLNKWDVVEKDDRTFDQTVKELRARLGPYGHLPIVSLSALTGLRVNRVFELVDAVHRDWGKRIPTSRLNEFLEEAMREMAVPVVGTKRTRIYYLSQTREAPPVFSAVTSYPEGIPAHYERFLVNRLRDSFGFAGVPVRIQFRRRKRSGDE